MSISDNFFEVSAKEREDNAVTAPVELVVDFLALLSEEKYQEALEKARDIQHYEPGNKMIKDYVKSLTTLLRQQEEEKLLARFEESSSEEEEDEDDDDDDDDSGKGGDSDSDESKEGGVSDSESEGAHTDIE